MLDILKKLSNFIIQIILLSSCIKKDSKKDSVISKAFFNYRNENNIELTRFEFIRDTYSDNIYFYVKDSISRENLKKREELVSFLFKSNDSVFRGVVESQFSKKEIVDRFALLTEIRKGRPVVSSFNGKEVFIIGSLDRLKYFVNNNVIKLRNDSIRGNSTD